MNKHTNLDRRNFLTRSAATVGLFALAGTIRAEDTDKPTAPTPPSVAMPQITHRPLGRTKIEISEIAGAGDALRDPVMFALATHAGVNYIHKADSCFTNTRNRETLLKDREKFYLDVVIDSLDEDRAYEEFERRRQATGSEYIDFYKVHSTWKTPDDFKEKRGVLAAYDRLKKEKKVRWLALSKHGENTPEVLMAAMESDLFDQIQPAVPDVKDLQQILTMAKDKGVGVICMKSGKAIKSKGPEIARLGDPATPYRTFLRYLLSLNGVTAVVSNTKTLDQMRENYSASGQPMTKAELETMTVALANAPRDYRDCITCGKCQEDCGLAVADIMRYRMYAEDYGDYGIARQYYAELPAAWKKLVATGVPDAVCPFGLALADELKQAHRWLA
jgi:predicted aldo/keto reductase-like oxidoreductase